MDPLISKIIDIRKIMINESKNTESISDAIKILQDLNILITKTLINNGQFTCLNNECSDCVDYYNKILFERM